ncbi:MAG: hypothetical protein K6U80_17890 [Firmicutes bacterium]|nr:hypothetical protein [Bacillota bacterium]
MRKRYRIIFFIFIALALSGLFPAPNHAVTAESLSTGISRDAALEYILNYPFTTLSDLRKIQDQLKLLPVPAHSTPDYFSSPEFFAGVKAFTEINAKNGEELSIVSFAHSNNKALRALREEVKIPPPKGGAIVRVYASKSVMPPPVKAMFQGDIQGITHWYRFIAVNGARKSPEELENIISHELVHAYIFSALGKNDTLPNWFNEGVALYLSGTKDQYISPGGFFGDFISRASDEYEEYRQVFKYLERSQGRQGVTRFIRQTVERQSVMDSLPQVAGATDYVDLRNKARHWHTARQNFWAGLGIGSIMILVVLGSWLGKRRRLRQKTRLQNQARRLEKLVRAYDRQIVALTRKSLEVKAGKERRKSDSRLAQMKQKKAIALVSLGRIMVRLGVPAEAGHLYAEAMENAGQWPKMVEMVQQAQDELKGWIV